MELPSLLGSQFQCNCGRTHTVPVRKFVYATDAILQLPQIVRDCGQQASPRTMVVADARTWDICGRRVFETLSDAGFRTDHVIVPDTDHGGPICDQETYRSVLAQLRGQGAELVVAVGSGVINDLCKWTSFELGVPYLVVGTAGSMNGYAAANVAAKVEGVKILVEARAPLAVVAEASVIERAPFEMIAAGFGDTIAKFQSNTDWLINNRLLDEYYCDFCAGIVADLEHLYLDHPEDIQHGKPEAVGGLFEALFWTGLAMTLVGTSAPASGGEHLLSHTLDMIAGVRGGRHDLHGRQVGVGTLFSAAMYERVLAVEDPAPRSLPPSIDRAFWAVPAVTKAVENQYEAKKPAVDRICRELVAGDTWDQLRTLLAGETKTPQTIRHWLDRAGAAISPADIGCTRDELRTAALHMHEIRKRFTIVDLAWLVGVLPGAVDEIIDTWLVPR